jgi:hypothetical protein
MSYGYCLDCVVPSAKEHSETLSAGKPEVPAYYSQPTRYAMDYTTGIHAREDGPIVYGYPTRLNARELYEL